jgi:hypothetical protein
MGKQATNCDPCPTTRTTKVNRDAVKENYYAREAKPTTITNVIVGFFPKDVVSPFNNKKKILIRMKIFKRLQIFFKNTTFRKNHNIRFMQMPKNNF